MKRAIHQFLAENFSKGGFGFGELSEALANHLCTPEFTERHRQRILFLPDLGNEALNHKWSIAMSALTDAMAAAITTLKSQAGSGGPTTDQITAQIHTVVDPAVAGLTDKISAITASEADDAAKISDINAALAEFTTAFAPATTPAPAAPADGTAAATLAAAASGS